MVLHISYKSLLYKFMLILENLLRRQLEQAKLWEKLSFLHCKETEARGGDSGRSRGGGGKDSS